MTIDNMRVADPRRFAMANALYGAGGFHAKATAMMDVVRAAGEAWALPARYSDDQHRNLVEALRPWLEPPERPVE